MRLVKFVILFLLMPAGIRAQNDLMDLLNDSTAKVTNYAIGTFKSSRIMNGHSVVSMPPGQLDVRFSHRFGRLNTGPYEFWGLDQANVHFSFEYGICKWMMLGVGRGTYEKTYDGFAKFTVLRQSSGAKEMPVSVSAFTSIAVNTLKWTDPQKPNYFSSRLSYVAQVLVARKFGEELSVQLTPSFVHRNLVATELDPNDLWALGAGSRIKLTKRISFNAEYYYLLTPRKYMSESVYNPLSLGFDIQTGGHVFQLLFTNSLAMIEKGFIGETTGQWKKGDIHFGFNISRVFTLKKH